MNIKKNLNEEFKRHTKDLIKENLDKKQIWDQLNDLCRSGQRDSIDLAFQIGEGLLGDSGMDEWYEKFWGVFRDFIEGLHSSKVDAIYEYSNYTRPLEITPNNITKVPENIHWLNIEKIVANNANITYIPKQLFKCKTVTNLNFEWCNLNELPSGIVQMSNLKQLRLYDNKIREIPSFIGELKNLKLILIQCQKEGIIPDSILKLKNLKGFKLELLDGTESDVNNFIRKNRGVLQKLDKNGVKYYIEKGL